MVTSFVIVYVNVSTKNNQLILSLSRLSTFYMKCHNFFLCVKYATTFFFFTLKKGMMADVQKTFTTTDFAFMMQYGMAVSFQVYVGVVCFTITKCYK